MTAKSKVQSLRSKVASIPSLWAWRVLCAFLLACLCYTTAKFLDANERANQSVYTIISLGRGDGL